MPIAGTAAFPKFHPDALCSNLILDFILSSCSLFLILDLLSKVLCFRNVVAVSLSQVFLFCNVYTFQLILTQEMEVAIPDPAKFAAHSAAGETKSVATVPPLPRQESHKGTFVDRGVGSPRIVKSPSAGAFMTNLKLGSESKVFIMFLP